jgi:hypothetical protein
VEVSVPERGTFLLFQPIWYSVQYQSCDDEKCERGDPCGDCMDDDGKDTRVPKMDKSTNTITVKKWTSVSSALPFEDIVEEVMIQHRCQLKLPKSGEPYTPDKTRHCRRAYRCDVHTFSAKNPTGVECPPACADRVAFWYHCPNNDSCEVYDRTNGFLPKRKIYLRHFGWCFLLVCLLLLCCIL